MYGVSLVIITLFMLSEASIGAFPIKNVLYQALFARHSAGIKRSYFKMVHPGISFQFRLRLSSEALQHVYVY